MTKTLDMRRRMTRMGFVLLSLSLAACTTSVTTGGVQESVRSTRVLAPGEPDVVLPDPASLPRPSGSPDAGALLH